MDKSGLYRKISRQKKESQPLDVILEIDKPRNYKVASQIDKVGEVIHVFSHIPYIAAVLEPEKAEQVANKVYGREVDRVFHRSFSSGLETVRGIELANEYKAIPLPQVKNSQFQDELWNLRNMGVYEALQTSQGKGVNIGIIDTGIDYNHPEVKKRFGSVKGVDFVSGKDPFDQNGHGTHVAGIAAGEKVGIARQSNLYAIRVLDENGSGSEISIMQALEWSLDNAMDIVNMSLGASDYTRAFEELCNYSHKNGLILVAAAGNDGTVRKSYPAAFGESVISVTAVDSDNAHAYFSNINDKNDISAPGVDVYSSFPGGRYREFSGTSMASPGVAGVLALGYSITGTPDPLEYTLKESAEELGPPDYYGAGLARADKFVRRLINMQSRKPSLLERVLSL